MNIVAGSLSPSLTHLLYLSLSPPELPLPSLNLTLFIPSLKPCSLPRLALASRRIGRGGPPRSRLRVDTKFVSFRRGFGSRVGKLTLYRGERSVPDKTLA